MVCGIDPSVSSAHTNDRSIHGHFSGDVLRVEVLILDECDLNIIHIPSSPHDMSNASRTSCIEQLSSVHFRNPRSVILKVSASNGGVVPVRTSPKDQANYLTSMAVVFQSLTQQAINADYFHGDLFWDHPTRLATCFADRIDILVKSLQPVRPYIRIRRSSSSSSFGSRRLAR
jgi:hypothetical protein